MSQQAMQKEIDELKKSTINLQNDFNQMDAQNNAIDQDYKAVE